MKTENDLLKESMESASLKNEQRNDPSLDDYTKPMLRFAVDHVGGSYPCKYGKSIPNKIIYDLPHLLSTVDVDENRGDIKYENKYIEAKGSYLKFGSKICSIKNIRLYQKLDHYLIWLINEKPKKNFVLKFYLVNTDFFDHPLIKDKLTPQNGTKESNENNDKIGYGLSIEQSLFEYYLNQYNLLDGTNYNSLLSFFSKTTMKNNLTTSRKPRTKISYIVTKDNLTTEIKGDTNADSIVKLIKYLGPKNCVGNVWSAYLNTTQNKYRNEYVGEGYYLNPKISFRDMKTVISKLNINNKFNIILKEN